MDINSIVLHPDFPQKAWIVIEQIRNEPERLAYDPTSRSFKPSGYRSLLYERKFSGAYGWIGGTGLPPQPHHDVLLLTMQSLVPGTVLLGYVCGVFLRLDGDNKFVAVDDAIASGMDHMDLDCLDEAWQQDLRKLYPRVVTGEGWFGAQTAFSELLKTPQHD
jgi:inorganic pyrophosphatase